ncbi:hypothetical protein SLA2020_404470 [Shorea laevis]
MAVTLWKAEYQHLAFLEEVMGSQSSISFCLAVSSVASYASSFASQKMQLCQSLIHPTIYSFRPQDDIITRIETALYRNQRP